MQDVINSRDDKHQTEMQTLRSRLLEMTKEKEQEISMRKAMETELRMRVAELSKRITTLEAALCAKKEEARTKVKLNYFRSMKLYKGTAVLTKLYSFVLFVCLID